MMPSSPPNACAILLAGGSNARMKGKVEDKILHPLAGRSVWRYSFDAFLSSDRIQSYVIVYRDSEQRDSINEGLKADESSLVTFVKGGAQRQDSVWSGLQAVPPDTSIVLIHDCARPLIDPDTIQKIVAAAQMHGAASVARQTTDTIKKGHRVGDLHRLKTVDRSDLWSMETPQAFSYPLIRDAYQQVILSNQTITDDLSAIEPSGRPIQLIESPRPNLKITHPEDLDLIASLLSKNPDLSQP